MIPSMAIQLAPREVHIWHTSIGRFIDKSHDFRKLLTSDELSRADRFYFPIHQQRFTIARAMLRHILSFYLLDAPQNLRFSYSQHGKPFFAEANLHFNLSHSHDMAIIAIVQDHAIGVDIEKIEEKYNDDVAERYFSAQEYEQLQSFSSAEKISAFYEIWARKEAIVKAVGEGLGFPLKSFSVDLRQQHETLWVSQVQWHLTSFNVDRQYASAFVTTLPVEKVLYWEWNGVSDDKM